MKNLLPIAIIILILFLFVFVVGVAINKSARVECLHWQQEAQNYQGFYLTRWQAEQCKSVKVEVNAPIK